jgi:hypothetical protein
VNYPLTASTAFIRRISICYTVPEAFVRKRHVSVHERNNSVREWEEEGKEGVGESEWESERRKVLLVLVRKIVIEDAAYISVIFMSKKVCMRVHPCVYFPLCFSESAVLEMFS